MSGVEIKVPELEIENLEQRVIHEVARQVLQDWQVDYDNGDEFPVKSRVAREVEKACVAAVRQVAENLAPAFFAKLLEREVLITDDMGYRQGAEKRVEDIILAEMRKGLQTSHNSNRGSVLEGLIKEQARGVLKAELEQAIAELRAPIVDAMRVEAVGVFERAMRTALGGLQG